MDERKSGWVGLRVDENEVEPACSMRSKRVGPARGMRAHCADQSCSNPSATQTFATHVGVVEDDGLEHVEEEQHCNDSAPFLQGGVERVATPQRSAEIVGCFRGRVNHSRNALVTVVGFFY